VESYLIVRESLRKLNNKLTKFPRKLLNLTMVLMILRLI